MDMWGYTYFKEKLTDASNSQYLLCTNVISQGKDQQLKKCEILWPDSPTRTHQEMR